MDIQADVQGDGYVRGRAQFEREGSADKGIKNEEP
jgi:hypothetical protein